MGMKTKVVKSIIALSLVATMTCLVGLGLVIDDQFSVADGAITAQSKGMSGDQNIKKNNDKSSNIFAFGDSLTRGTGDKTGKGYIGDLLGQLKAQSDHSIHLSNIAIKGQTSVELAKQIKQPEIQRQIKQADILIFTIGGNDLFNGGEALVNFSEESIQQSQTNYLKDLNEILKTLRRLNDTATIYHVGLYNPFIKLDDGKETSSAVMEWNNQTIEAENHYSHVVFVPTFDLFQLHPNDLLYSDHFHPNAEGYKLIANRLASLIQIGKGVQHE